MTRGYQQGVGKYKLNRIFAVNKAIPIPNNVDKVREIKIKVIKQIIEGKIKCQKLDLN